MERLNEPEMETLSPSTNLIAPVEVLALHPNFSSISARKSFRKIGAAGEIIAYRNATSRTPNSSSAVRLAEERITEKKFTVPGSLRINGESQKKLSFSDDSCDSILHGAAVLAKSLDRLGNIIADSTKATITTASVAIQLQTINSLSMIDMERHEEL